MSINYRRNFIDENKNKILDNFMNNLKEKIRKYEILFQKYIFF